MKTVYFLTGDIGGTNSRMFLYDSSKSQPLAFRLFRNQDFLPTDCYGDDTIFQRNIIIPFLEECWAEQEKYNLLDLDQVEIRAVLAVAGVVTNNHCNVTNLGNMLVDGNLIAADESSDVSKAIVTCMIINDFVAQGYGCLTLQPHEVRHLFGPDNVLELPPGPKVCIGAGTGLGECYLTTNSSAPDSLYTCFASEGGHVEFAPRNDLEVRMFQYLSDKFCSKNRISIERVVSGKGLANVYEFLAHEFPVNVDETIHQEFLNAGDDKGRVVAVNAKKNDLCNQAMRIMISAYGCEVGSAAIKWIPTGGLFVSGGLTPKNIEFIEGLHSDFMQAYRNKGRVSFLLDTIPLFAVMVEDLGVRGAHKAAVMEYEHRCKEVESEMVVNTKGALVVSPKVWAGAATVIAVASFCLGGLVFSRRK